MAAAKTLGVLLVFAGLPATCIYIEGSAELAAKAFCRGISVGDPSTAVIAATAAAGNGARVAVRDDRILVSYRGMPPFSVHACVVDLSGGLVTGVNHVQND